MKTRLLPILVVIFAGLAVSQDAGARPTRKPSTEQLLIQLENDWARVDVNGDMSVFERVLAPDVVSTAIRGDQVSVVTSRKEFVAHYENGGSDPGGDFQQCGEHGEAHSMFAPRDGTGPGIRW
jgi:hypothetical protein